MKAVFYRNPDPPPTYERAVAERRRLLEGKGTPRLHILEEFVPR